MRPLLLSLEMLRYLFEQTNGGAGLRVLVVVVVYLNATSDSNILQLETNIGRASSSIYCIAYVWIPWPVISKIKNGGLDQYGAGVEWVK